MARTKQSEDEVIDQLPVQNSEVTTNEVKVEEPVSKSIPEKDVKSGEKLVAVPRGKDFKRKYKRTI